MAEIDHPLAKWVGRKLLIDRNQNGVEKPGKENEGMVMGFPKLGFPGLVIFGWLPGPPKMIARFGKQPGTSMPGVYKCSYYEPAMPLKQLGTQRPQPCPCSTVQYEPSKKLAIPAAASLPVVPSPNT